MKCTKLVLFTMRMSCKGLLNLGIARAHFQNNQWPLLISYRQKKSKQLQQAAAACITEPQTHHGKLMYK